MDRESFLSLRERSILYSDHCVTWLLLRHYQLVHLARGLWLINTITHTKGHHSFSQVCQALGSRVHRNSVSDTEIGVVPWPMEALGICSCPRSQSRLVTPHLACWSSRHNFLSDILKREVRAWERGSGKEVVLIHNDTLFSRPNLTCYGRLDWSLQMDGWPCILTVESPIHVIQMIKYCFVDYLFIHCL